MQQSHWSVRNQLILFLIKDKLIKTDSNHHLPGNALYQITTQAETKQLNH